MATRRNTNNFNTVIENFAEERNGKSYIKDRPITLAEQLEAEKMRKKEKVKVADQKRQKEEEEKEWLAKANSSQRIVSRKMNYSHLRYNIRQ